MAALFSQTPQTCLKLEPWWSEPPVPIIHSAQSEHKFAFRLDCQHNTEHVFGHVKSSRSSKSAHAMSTFIVGY